MLITKLTACRAKNNGPLSGTSVCFRLEITQSSSIYENLHMQNQINPKETSVVIICGSTYSISSVLRPYLARQMRLSSSVKINLDRCHSNGSELAEPRKSNSCHRIVSCCLKTAHELMRLDDGWAQLAQISQIIRYGAPSVNKVQMPASSCVFPSNIIQLISTYGLVTRLETAVTRGRTDRHFSTQESFAIVKMTSRCADKSKRTATHATPQPEIMDVTLG